jgi:Domain of unknown function (DUF4440)
MSDIVGKLTELNKAFAKAELAADVEFFRSYLTDGLRFRRATGNVVDKITFLKDLGVPENTNERLTVHQIEVQPYGEDFALCSMVVDFKGMRGGKQTEGTFRNTRAFVRSEGLWKCAVWFNSVEPAS